MGTNIIPGSADVTVMFALPVNLTVADLRLRYVRDGAAASTEQAAVELAAADSAHTDNRAYESADGVYRVDWPDAAFATAVNGVTLVVRLDGQEQPLATERVTLAFLNPPTAAVVADAVLDELPAEHDTEDSLGNVLNDLTEENAGTYRFTTGALSQAPTGGATPGEIADAVLDEQMSGHQASGSLGREVHLVKAALVNKREHTIDTGVDVIKDDDGSTTLRTLTPSESDGVVTVTPG